jgi:hypothetical protein
LSCTPEAIVSVDEHIEDPWDKSVFDCYRTNYLPSVIDNGLNDFQVENAFPVFVRSDIGKSVYQSIAVCIIFKVTKTREIEQSYVSDCLMLLLFDFIAENRLCELLPACFFLVFRGFDKNFFVDLVVSVNILVITIIAISSQPFKVEPNV